MYGSWVYFYCPFKHVMYFMLGMSLCVFISQLCLRTMVWEFKKLKLALQNRRSDERLTAQRRRKPTIKCEIQLELQLWQMDTSLCESVRCIIQKLFPKNSHFLSLVEFFCFFGSMLIKQLSSTKGRGYFTTMGI